MPLWTNVLSPRTLTTRRASSCGQGVAEPQPHADAGAHADQRVHRLPWRQGPQRIAADVARHNAIELLQHAENGAVRAALAQGRRLAGHGSGLGRSIAGNDPPHAGHVQFAEAIHLGLAFHRNARSAELLNEIRVAFLDDQAAIDACGEAADLLQGQRVGEAQFQHGGVRRGLANVHETDAGGDDAELADVLDCKLRIANLKLQIFILQFAIPATRALTGHHLIWTMLFVPLGQFGQLLPQAAMGGPGVAGDHHSRANVAIEMRSHDVPFPRLRADHGLRVADPRGGSQEDRQVPAGGQFHRQEGEIVRLLGVGRFEHRHGCRDGKAAVVLFILAGCHARIVGRDDH